MAKFSDIPWFILEDYFNEVAEVNDYSGPVPEYTSANNDGAMLFRNQSAIVVKSYSILNFYAKNEDSTYKEMRVKIQSGWDAEYNKIITKKSSLIDASPSEVIKRIVQEYGYERITYDAISIDSGESVLEQGDDIYIRKDEHFFEWFEDNIEQYNRFFNHEKLFSFIGSGYQNNNQEIKIWYYSLKDWMKDALPQNNRNYNLDTFIDLIYDRIYSKIYNNQKDLMTLIDPREINVEFLDDLFTYYDVPPMDLEVDLYKKRVFVDNLVYWLKKKGTYASLYIIWRIFGAPSGNLFTTYDRWHPALSGIPYEQFEDWPYVNYYKDGELYPVTYNVELTGSPGSTDFSIDDYNYRPESLYMLNSPKAFFDNPSLDYGFDGTVLSTHYKVEFDLNHGPMQNGMVLSKNMMNDLYKYWEFTRPVTRVAHYHAYITTDMTWQDQKFERYRDPNLDGAYIITYNEITTVLPKAANAYIHLQLSENTSWLVNHNLGTEDIVIHAYNVDYKRIYPSSIQINDPYSVRVYFDDVSVAGFALVKKSDYSEEINTIQNSYTINHDLGVFGYTISQYYNLENKVYKPLSIEYLDGNSIEVEDFIGKTTMMRADRVYTQVNPSDEWVINHSLNANGVMVEVYDENNQVIVPESIELLDSKNCRITFDSAIIGKAVFKKIGEVQTASITDNFEDEWEVKLGNGTDIENWDFSTNGMKNTIYIINCDNSNYNVDSDQNYNFHIQIPRNTDIGYITEIGLFDKYGDLAFYTRVDYMYKIPDVIIDLYYKISFY